MTQLPESSQLSGADWFMMAMEPHMTRFKPVGNVCRYVMFLNGRIESQQLRNLLAEKKVTEWLAGLRIKKGLPFQIPRWVHSADHTWVNIREHESGDAVIPEHIMHRDISMEEPPLFQFDIIHRPGNQSTLLFSWHHILMDGRGAGMLLRYLNGEAEFPDYSCLVPRDRKSHTVREAWNNMMETKDFLKESSLKPLATFLREEPTVQPQTHYRIMKFDQEQTRCIHAHAQQNGSRFGHSPFYLAVTARAAHEILKRRGDTGKPFWIPVPQDERLRGAAGPLITNQLSFIFYRIPPSVLGSVKEAVQHINGQLVQQIRDGIPDSYGRMMDWFRRMPLNLYYRLIKGPAGGSIASFLFSVAADSPEDLNRFMGLEVEDAINFPPNTYPPGLTVVFMRFRGTLKVITSYVEQSISTFEVSCLEEVIRQGLMEGDPVA